MWSILSLKSIHILSLKIQHLDKNTREWTIDKTKHRFWKHAWRQTLSSRDERRTTLTVTTKKRWEWEREFIILSLTLKWGMVLLLPWLLVVYKGAQWLVCFCIFSKKQSQQWLLSKSLNGWMYYSLQFGSWMHCLVRTLN